jgi:hypothetical protein
MAGLKLRASAMAVTTLSIAWAGVAVDIEPRSRHGRQAMNKGLAMIVGAGMGAGLMYLSGVTYER